MSYWSDFKVNYPSLRHDIRVGVAVIGAGITGASVSYWLSNNCNVALLESESIASKASGRNAGFLLTGTSDHYSKAVKRYGRVKAKSIWKLAQQNHKLLETHILKNGIECEHKRSGSYLVAASSREMDEIKRSIALLKRDGFDYKLIGEKETNEILHTGGFYGAAFNALDGEINPVKLVHGFIKIVSDRNAYVFENTYVKRIARKDVFEVKTRYGSVKADYVVLTANAYTPLIYPRFKNVIMPMRGQALVTAACKKIFNGGFYANYGYEYWRQLPSGCILAGGFREADPAHERGYRMITTKKIQSKLNELLNKLSIKSRVLHRWSGIMGFTKDQLPVIGSVPDVKNLFISAGYSSHGLGFSFIAGNMIMKEILIKRHDKIFSPKRFFNVRV